MDLILVLAIYTLIILYFVPLERIAKVQSAWKKWVNKQLEKLKDKSSS